MTDQYRSQQLQSSNSFSVLGISVDKPSHRHALLLGFATGIVVLILLLIVGRKHVQEVPPHPLHSHPSYGYGGRIDNIVKEEITQFGDEVYLDYTGSGVYAVKSQLARVFEKMSTTFLGNTHSKSPCATRTDDIVESTRDRVLKFFNTNRAEYSVIFTASATAALKLVGEMFPIKKDSHFVYLKENHNSVLGIREFFVDKGADFGVVNEKEVWQQSKASDEKVEGESDEDVFHLFAYPAEDNYAGVKYPLDWIDIVHNKHSSFQKDKKGEWLVLLDAAAYAPTNRLDLSKSNPDFVAVSFYKLFGYPHLGCLLVRNELFSRDILRKLYFGGGTVVMSSCDSHFCILQGRPDTKYEDGTLPFLQIMAVPYGLDFLESLGIDAISDHVWTITQYTYDKLRELKHSNGKPVVEIYGKHDLRDHAQQGGIINFNVLDPTESFVGYHDVQVAAAEAGINLRTGAVCNPGACCEYLRIESEDIIKYYTQKTSCGDEMDVVGGRPLGSVRISIGYLNRVEDVDRFLEFLTNKYVH